MTTLERLESWRESGAIREEQYQAIAALVRKDRFSVYLELNVLLYLGVISFVAGVGWTIRTYFANLGDIAIVGSLSLLVGGAFYYCFSRTKPYSTLQVESPNIGFDYILYLGCLLFGVEIGYVETQFHLLTSQWDYYLLISALVYFANAYRFDNRFVLSLAISTLGAWFGVKTSRFGIVPWSHVRESAIAFSMTTATVGLFLHRAEIKRHFLETYLHLATIVLLGALLSGVGENASTLYFPGILAASSTAIWSGLLYRRFAFVVYGVIFGYIAISIEILKGTRDFTLALMYFVVSGLIVVVGLIVMARQIGKER